jgi:DNA mismatch repair ATPase MutS
VLYLLDEILQGTNTAERQIAARRVIRLLLKCRAIGAVSTHDLTLADAPDLASAAQAIHLTETVADAAEGARMSFDYQVRPGIARSTNALRLLDLVGLTDEG